MRSAITLREAVSCRAGFPALAGVDLDVATGEVLLVRGPNGAGKTTLLRLLAGLGRLDGGRGEVLGFDLRRDRRALRAQVGLLAHESMLYEDLTVAENLRFWAALAGADPGEPQAALDMLQVAPRLAGVPLRRLSAGQRKRVSLAALAVRRPRLWLLDEPHAGLDEAGRRAVNDLLAAAAGNGATVVLASHDAPAAAEVAERSVYLAGGVVRAAPASTAPAPSTPTAPATATPAPATAVAASLAPAAQEAGDA